MQKNVFLFKSLNSSHDQPNKRLNINKLAQALNSYEKNDTTDETEMVTNENSNEVNSSDDLKTDCTDREGLNLPYGATLNRVLSSTSLSVNNKIEKNSSRRSHDDASKSNYIFFIIPLFRKSYRILTIVCYKSV